MGNTRVNSRNWQDKLTEELTDYAIISAYFFVCFGAIMIYKAALLRESGIEFIPLSAAVVKALVLGKFVLIAKGLPIRVKSATQTILVKLLINTLLLFLVLLCFSVLEELIIGQIHGQPFMATLAEFQGTLLAEKLATALLLLLVLLPAVSITEISLAMGPGVLKKLLVSTSTDRNAS